MNVNKEKSLMEVSKCIKEAKTEHENLMKCLAKLDKLFAKSHKTKLFIIHAKVENQKPKPVILYEGEKTPIRELCQKASLVALSEIKQLTAIGGEKNDYLYDGTVESNGVKNGDTLSFIPAACGGMMAMMNGRLDTAAPSALEMASKELRKQAAILRSIKDCIETISSKVDCPDSVKSQLVKCEKNEQKRMLLLVQSDAAVAHEKGKTQPKPAWMTKLANKNK